MSDDNVIDVSDRFKKKQEERDDEKKIIEMVDTMTQVYDNTSERVDRGIETLFNSLLEAGYKPSDFVYPDYMLFREAIFSMIFRSRNVFHPLQIVAEDFHSLVQK